MICWHGLIKIYLLILTLSITFHYCELSRHKSVGSKSEHFRKTKPSGHYIHNSKLRHSSFVTRIKQLKDQERKFDSEILHNNLQVLNDRTRADLLKLRGSVLESYSKAGKFPVKYRNDKHRLRRDNEEYYKYILNEILSIVDGKTELGGQD